jgi:hypothetical protein
MTEELEPLHCPGTATDCAKKNSTSGEHNLQYLRKLTYCLRAVHAASQNDARLCAIISRSTTWLGATTSARTAVLADTAALEALIHTASTRCFGNQVRSPALGRRHLDKGVYIDQVLRWYASFNPAQFHFMSLEQFSRVSQQAMEELLEFMETPYMEQCASHTQFVTSLDYTKRRLERPNSRMPPFDTLPEQVRAGLQEYYEPYNALLNELGIII